MASLRQTLAQLRSLWTQLPTGRKVSFLLIFVTLAAAFTALVWWAGRPDYKTLFSELPIEDANAVVSKLKDMRTPYQLSRGGSTIAVPANDFYEVKMALANAGLPAGGAVGFELFDRKNLGLTDAQMKIAMLRALQGELARTIKQLGPVESARVHLALPKESLFIEDKKETTASIVLKLAANARLTDEQVDGIVFLVSSSVEGLSPENVTIIDQKGRVLSKRKDSAAGGGGDLDQKARKFEQQLEQRIETLLARSVGPEKVAARVNVQLDRDQVQKVEERFNPDEQVIRSQQSSTADNSSSEGGAAGAAGAETNVPEGGAPAEGTQTASKSLKKTETVNYEISRTTATTTQAGGAIKKLSVAVLIDGVYKEPGEGAKDKKKVYEPRTKEEMTTFTEVVKRVVGYNEQRGDLIEVANIQFVTEGGELDKTPAERMDTIIRFVNIGLAVLGALLFFLFVIRPLVRWLTTEPSLETQLGLPPEMLAGATVGELEARLTGRLPPGERPALEEAKVEAPPTEEDTLRERIKVLSKKKADLLETAGRDSEAVTLMIRRWLKEGARNA